MTTQATCSKPTPATLSFEVANVTGTRLFQASGVDPAVPAEALAQMFAAELSLPQNVPWALRNDDSAEFLEGGQEIGAQVDEGGAPVAYTEGPLGVDKEVWLEVNAGGTSARQIS